MLKKTTLFCANCESKVDSLQSVLTRKRNEDGQLTYEDLCDSCADAEELAIEQELEEITPHHCKDD